MDKNVTVILTPIETDQFIAFQKYYDLFLKLQDTKALEIGFGKCIINIAFGEVQNIVKEEVVYKK